MGWLILTEADEDEEVTDTDEFEADADADSSADEDDNTSDEDDSSSDEDDSSSDEDDNSDNSDEKTPEEIKNIESNFFDTQKNELQFQNFYDTQDSILALSDSLKTIFDSNTIDVIAKDKLFVIDNNLADLNEKIAKIIKHFNKISYDKKSTILDLCMKSITSSSDEINSIIGGTRTTTD